MESLQQLMLDHSPHLMLLVDPDDLRILLANRVAGQVLGYSLAQLQRMSITDIESSLQDVFYWEDVRNGQYQEIAAQEGEYHCADASLMTVMKTVRVIRQRERTLLLVLARDTRHERQVEDVLEQTLSQLRATLESTGNGILVLDWHGRISSMNRLFSRMWDLPESLLEAGDDAAILGYLAGLVVEGELCRTRLQQVVDANETVDLLSLRSGRVFECRSRPQYLGERIIGRVFGFTDITERQRAEQALRESRDQLEYRVRERTKDLQMANATLEQEKARQAELISKLGEAQSQLLQSEKMASIGVLAAGVAHEINNPVGFVNSNLGSLQRYAESLLRLLDAYEALEPKLATGDRAALAALKAEVDADYLREDLDSLLSESLEGLERVKRIVQDMKDFSHVDGGELAVASLEAGLDSTLNVVWNELKYKADVVKEYGGVAPLACFPSQLNQVFMNLLVNAAHAIEESGRITVRTGEDGQAVWVEIEDTGKGIPPELIDRIYEPFFTTKPVGKGTGLGLSLSYGIVQKHGGRMEVQSAVGKGTRFRVILPKQPAEQLSPSF
ncbi:ATP-binding protein [Massilia sp. NR 4-1]|uniref:ATP-binding protein n=1 Tax=Massilia sp. NR 4-1 TaxID=1678028 RepID=UPI00067D543F|nr:ATP-binding protein [Massilia sp. NR 4-1]AKU22765.1 histidine kinase [Massilia sp. NR 4-1]